VSEPQQRPPASLGLRPLRKLPLWLRYAGVVGGFSALALVVLGGLQTWSTYRTVRADREAALNARGDELAQAVDNALALVNRQVQAVTVLPWSESAWLSADDLHQEFGRLLRLIPSAQSVTLFDGLGHVHTQVSRLAPDHRAGPLLQGGRLADPAKAEFSYTVDRSDPSDPALVLHANALELGEGARIELRIGLRALARELKTALTAAHGAIAVIDEQGRVVLHQDALAILEAQAFPLPAPQPTDPLGELTAGRDPVFRVYRSVRAAPWRVVVEQPYAEVMRPVWASLWQLGGALTLTALLAMALSAWLARRMTRPIQAIGDGVAAFEAGALDRRVHLPQNDELGQLARRFNSMADSLEHSHTELAVRVAEKTRDLDLANRHKSEFLANMSHELRTPLNAVIGFSEALEAEMFGPLNPKQQEYVNDIHASGLHLLALINDVLDLSKIEAGRLELDLGAFHVETVLRHAMTLVRERAHQQGVRLDAVFEAELEDWVADERRFKQIAVNLLSNAVKFTPSGGAVTLRAGKNAREGLWVEVSDTGQGIATEHRELIFEAFRQVGSDGLRKAEGTGLGLALVRSLVAQHGGHITLDSIAGRGATFRFNIPAPPGPTDAPKGAA